PERVNRPREGSPPVLVNRPHYGAGRRTCQFPLVSTSCGDEVTLRKRREIDSWDRLPLPASFDDNLPKTRMTELQHLREELDRRTRELALARQQFQELAAELEALRGRLERQTGYLRDEISTELHYKKLIGNSPALRQVRQAIEQVAAADSTV